MSDPAKGSGISSTAKHHTITYARTTLGLMCGACQYCWEDTPSGDRTVLCCPDCGAVLPAFGLPH